MVRLCTDDMLHHAQNELILLSVLDATFEAASSLLKCVAGLLGRRRASTVGGRLTTM